MRTPKVVRSVLVAYSCALPAARCCQLRDV